MNRLINKLLRVLCILEIIPDRIDNQPYLARFILFRSKFLSVYIHRFLKSDDVHPHDHPWTFITLPIYKGYKEHLFKNEKEKVIERRPFVPALRLATDFHWVEIDRTYSIEELDIAPLSLCILFRYRKAWGFRYEDQWLTKDEFKRRLKGLQGI